MIKQAPTPGRLIAMAAFTLSCVGLLLFLMTMALNVASERFVRRVRERY